MMCRLFAYQYIMVLCVLYTVHCIRGGVQCYASIAAHFKNENLFDFYLIHLILIMILQFCCAAIRFISINNYKLKPNQNRKLWIRKYFVFNIWLLKSKAHTHTRAHISIFTECNISNAELTFYLSRCVSCKHMNCKINVIWKLLTDMRITFD